MAYDCRNGSSLPPANSQIAHDATGRAKLGDQSGVRRLPIRRMIWCIRMPRANSSRIGGKLRAEISQRKSNLFADCRQRGTNGCSLSAARANAAGDGSVRAIRRGGDELIGFPPAVLTPRPKPDVQMPVQLRLITEDTLAVSVMS